MSKPVRSVVWLVSIELMATVILTLFGYLSANIDTASVLFGALLFLLPSTYFTIYAFRFTSAQLTPFAVQMFYRGQMGKLILTGLGFALTFKFYSQLHPLTLFIVYGLMVGFHVLIARYVSNQFDQSDRYQNS